MLALSGPTGKVKAAVPGLANAARVSLEECERALVKFESPDQWSRSKAHEGRRIERIDGGFQILNYDYYRNNIQAEERKEYKAQKQREYRKKDKIKIVKSYYGPTTSEPEEKINAGTDHAPDGSRPGDDPGSQNPVGEVAH